MGWKGAHHEREDAEVDEEGEQEHTHGADNMIQKRYLLPRVEEHPVEASKVHCRGHSHVWMIHMSMTTLIVIKGGISTYFRIITHRQTGMRRLARQWS
jgi:hypothetical protein